MPFTGLPFLYTVTIRAAIALPYLHAVTIGLPYLHAVTIRAAIGLLYLHAVTIGLS